jgi:hypothetical protein
LDWLRADDVKEWDIRFVDSLRGIEDIRANVVPSDSFRGLRENTPYRVAIRARNDSGTSDFSPALIILTRPPRPQPPFLANSDEDTRGFDYIKLAWDPTAAQYEYDLRLNQGAELRNQTSGNAISSLQADTVQSIEVRARDAITNNISFWSSAFVTITRPLTPSSLEPPVYQPFIPTLAIEWEFQADVGSFVELRQQTTGDNTIVVTRGNLKGLFVLQAYEFGVERRFAIRLVTPRNEAPNGLNESFWSPETASSPAFPLSLFDAIEASKYEALNAFSKFPKIS